MPYKSKVKRRIYQREYKRRIRGFYNNSKSEAIKPNSVKPFVKPGEARGSKHTVRCPGKARDDLRTDLPGGECWWGIEDTD